MAVHVLAYVDRARLLALADLRPRRGKGMSILLAGRVTRRGLLVGSVVLGLALALAAIPLDASWIHWLARVGPEQ